MKKYEYKGHKFWVTVDPTINTETNGTIYLAYISNTEPKGLLYGELVKQPNGKPMIFEDTITAYTNAYGVRKSEIDSKPV